MKKLTLTLCAIAAVASASFAGTESYSGKEMKQMAPPPCPSWYADNEWNVGISGIYAISTDDDDNNNVFFDNSWDDGFGGALDVKYFFRRYFGVGIQAFGLGVDRDDNNINRFNNDDNDFAGGVLGTFTFRYPIPCSRFAPYIWGGLGVYFHDDNNNFVGANFNNDDNDACFMGQIGAGFEVRITPHIGWTNDVSYNFVADDDNNNNFNNGNQDFVMIRTGLNFAF